MIILPDEGRDKIFEKLLALNADQLWSCAFAVRQDRVIITADRTTRDLDRSEVVEMIERVAETMTSEIELRFSTLTGDETVFQGRGGNACLETQGELAAVLVG